MKKNQETNAERLARALVEQNAEGEALVRAAIAADASKVWRALVRGLLRAAWSDTPGDICRRRRIKFRTIKGAPFLGERIALLGAMHSMNDDELRGLAVELVTRGRSFGNAPETGFDELRALLGQKTREETEGFPW